MARRARRWPTVTAPTTAAPTAKPAAATADNCQIKGNINRKGDQIYHVPGSRDYEKTVIDTGSGERMFCTEDEAKAAGWRAPRS